MRPELIKAFCILALGILPVGGNYAQTTSRQLSLSGATVRDLQQAWQAVETNNTKATLAALARLEAYRQPNGLLITEINLLKSRFWLTSHLDKSVAKLTEVLTWLARNQGRFRVSSHFRRKLFKTSTLVYQADNRPLDVARTWIKAGTWLPDAKKRNASDQIWQALQATPYHLLTEQLVLTAEENDLDLQGWYQLAQTAYYALSPDQQYEIWLSWRKIWPEHLAAVQPPNLLRKLPEIARERPKKVAALLPLTGPLGRAGRAIQDGIVSAYFLTSPSHRIAFSFFDTGSRNLRELYTQALAEGAEMILGPLEKNKLSELTKFATKEVPILALNYLPKGTRLTNLPRFYQLGLSPETEHDQLVERGLKEAGRRALIIHSTDDWGEQNASLIAQKWQQAGGRIVDQVAINLPQNAVERMAGALHVDLSTKRSQDIRKLIGMPIEFQARRRQDIDLIFLVANKAITNVANPTLAYHFADDLPVYSLSRWIPTDNQNYPDLTGILYCDLPWRIYGHSLKPTLEKLRPASTGLSYGLFALGVDVTGLVSRLPQFEQERGLRLNGVTGIFSLQRGKRFHRQLAWASVTGGFSVPLSPASSQP